MVVAKKVKIAGIGARVSGSQAPELGFEVQPCRVLLSAEFLMSPKI